MISSTSDNFAVLQSDCKNQVIAKNRRGGGEHAPRAPSLNPPLEDTEAVVHECSSK